MTCYHRHYCIICDNRRKLSWGHAIEAQTVVNRFLYWLIKSRGFVGRAPHLQLSNVYVQQEEIDHLFAKRQVTNWKKAFQNDKNFFQKLRKRDFGVSYYKSGRS